MIQLIVEGRGEVNAAPTLVRRLLWELQVFSVGVRGEAQFLPKNRMTDSAEHFKRSINLSRYDPDITALMYVFDADDDCARKYLPNMKQWVAEANPSIPVGIVMATREYEAWFLASLESLGGWRGIPTGARVQGDPETKRDAKGLSQ